jgi:shikimate kinase / 3-dehydroquinate synthase
MPDAITLVGLSASGKSSVGRLVAESLGRPFIDLDARIKAETGSSPARIIEREGEARFRQIEAAEVRRAADVPGAVIATGGGAVVDPLSRWALWEAGTAVWLDAPDERLAERVRRSGERRPLVARDPLAALARLRAAREPFYAAADHRVESAGSTRAVAAAVLAAASRPRSGARRLYDAQARRDHPMGPRTARIVYGRDLDAAMLGPLVAGLSTGAPVVVADERAAVALPGLMAALPGERQLRITAGERGKRMRSVERLLESAAALRAERGDAWIAVGGGTTGDLVGTAAAFYLRGSPLIQVPTTWLAQSDSAIGGKVAVDLAAAKNAAGAFWPPVAVIGDVAALRSLPRQLLLDGLAEVLKSAIIGDPWLWSLLETRGQAALGDESGGSPDEAARYAMVERAMRLKLGVVDRDPFESGERRSLNLGHTLGHALEIESRYRLPHGQAVVLGLRAVTAIAECRGAEPGLSERIDALLRLLGYRLTRSFDRDAVRGALGSDKKRVRGRQRWILPMTIGSVVDVDDVTESELDLALDRITPFARGDRA